MNRYPTPPSTSSPKYISANHGYHSDQDIGVGERRQPTIYENAATTDSYTSHPQTQFQDQKSTLNSIFTNASTIVPSSTSTSAWTSVPSKPLEVHNMHAMHEIPNHDFHGITSQNPSYNLPSIPNLSDAPPIATFKTTPQDLGSEKDGRYSYNYNYTYTNDPNTQIPSQAQTKPHQPAQETYWETNSDPVSPYIAPTPSQSHNQHSYPEEFNPSYPTHPGPPPRRSSSPIPNTLPSVTSTNPNPNSNPKPYYNPPSWDPSQPPPFQPPQSQPHPLPHRRRSSPLPNRIPSPLSKPLSPHSLSRPKPRPSLLKRLTRRFKSVLSSLLSWIKKNPIKTSLFTFLPLILGAGVVKSVKGIGALLGVRALRRERDKKKGKERKEEGKEGRRERTTGEKWHEDIFGEFQGFAGSKGGPLNGFLMIVHMLVNHYCKLSPSNIPRAASILLELYFLDMKKL